MALALSSSSVRSCFRCTLAPTEGVLARVQYRHEYRGAGGYTRARVLSSLVLVLGEAVEEGAGDGDGRAESAEGRDGGLEDEDGGEDDDHSLDRVRHRVRHGRHLGEREEGDLVVDVVEEA